MQQRLIFLALGNPGNEYIKSRHNAGWLMLDWLLEKWSDPTIPLVWKNERKINGLVTKIQVGNREVVAIKPQTFMNRSGEAAKAALQWYNNWDPEKPDDNVPNLIVLHDDLDLELGKYKLKFGSGPKDHNGINSVRQNLGTDQFWYVRLGIDNRQGIRNIPSEVYVLQQMNAEEINQLQQLSDQLATEIEYLV